VTHVVTIAKPARRFPSHITTMFEPGLHIGEQLAGVIVIL
jgi:hypothetical protein